MRNEHLGTDMQFQTDLVADSNGDAQAVTGMECLLQDLALRLQTPRGGLLRHPEYGLDFYRFLHAAFSDANLLALAGEVQDQVERDPRVRKNSARATLVSWDRGSISLQVSGRAVQDSTPFSLVIGWGAENATQEVFDGLSD